MSEKSRRDIEEEVSEKSRRIGREAAPHKCQRYREGGQALIDIEEVVSEISRSTILSRKGVGYVPGRNLWIVEKNQETFLAVR